MVVNRLLAIATLIVASMASAGYVHADNDWLGGEVGASAINENTLGADDLPVFSEWDNAMQDAVASASLGAEGETDLEEAIAVPEPSAFALLGGLAAILLAITLVRWHFDHTIAEPAVAPKHK